MLPAENVGEGEAGIQLFGFDQKPSAIGDPWFRCFHALIQFSVLSSQFSVVSFQYSITNGDG